MSTQQQLWRLHRTDYRLPGLMALAIVLLTMTHLPVDWLRRVWFGGRVTETVPELSFPPALADGIRLIEVARPAGAPASSVSGEASVHVFVSDTDAVAEETEGLEEAAVDWSWDPSSPYAIQRDLLGSRPAGPPEDLEASKLLRHLMSSRGFEGVALADTSHAALAQLSFHELQHQIFERNIPAWVEEARAQRFEEFWQKVIMEEQD